LLAQLLEMILRLCGFGRQKSDAERHECNAKDLGAAEEQAKNNENALKASEHARELETRMRDQQANPTDKPPRQAKSGQQVFRLLSLIALPLILVSGLNCVSHRPPPSMAVVCPEIPVPHKPVLPSVTIPEPRIFEYQNGVPLDTPLKEYCLTQEEMDRILVGIDLLTDYAETLERTIQTYNTGRSASGKEK
jgi:hypothetical protein